MATVRAGIRYANHTKINFISTQYSETPEAGKYNFTAHLAHAKKFEGIEDARGVLLDLTKSMVRNPNVVVTLVISDSKGLALEVFKHPNEKPQSEKIEDWDRLK
jgi:hypothetical protein